MIAEVFDITEQSCRQLGHGRPLPVFGALTAMAGLIHLSEVM